MKKVIFYSVIALLSASTIASFLLAKEDSILTPLQLENIEALTNNEGSLLDPDCPSGWKVECYRWSNLESNTVHIYYREYRSGEI